MHKALEPWKCINKYNCNKRLTIHRFKHRGRYILNFRLFYDNGSIQFFFPHAKNHNLPVFCHPINHNNADLGAAIYPGENICSCSLPEETNKGM